MFLMDAFSSYEALGMGQSVSGGGQAAKTAKFEPGGRQPIGYYKDPEKSARTFIIVDRKRYSWPGDHAVLEEDGSSACSAGVRCASTPVARRSSPRRSRKPSRPTPASVTQSWSASPTNASGR